MLFTKAQQVNTFVVVAVVVQIPPSQNSDLTLRFGGWRARQIGYWSWLCVCAYVFMHKWDATKNGRLNALLLLLLNSLSMCDRDRGRAREKGKECVCVSFLCFDFVLLALLKLSAFYMKWRDTAPVSVALVLQLVFLLPSDISLVHLCQSVCAVFVCVPSEMNPKMNNS